MIFSEIPKGRIYPIALAWLKLATCGRFKALNRADHLVGLREGLKILKVGSREGLTILKESYFPLSALETVYST